MDAAVPLALAVATAPALRPGRGLAVAGALHLALVVAVLLWIHARVPAPPPDGPVITVAVETTPQGNTALDVTPAHVASSSVAPPQPDQAASPVVQHPVPAVRGKPDLSVPPVVPRTPPPVLVRPDAHPPLLVRGTNLPGGKVGRMVVGATRPASPDADSTVYYSEISRQLGEQGEVRLRIVVSPSGAPWRVTLEKTSGYWRLDDDARASALTWHFQPALRHGVPVESVLSYWVRFQLQ